jgi:hypothetical protein
VGTAEEYIQETAAVAHQKILRRQGKRDKTSKKLSLNVQADNKYLKNK